MSLVGFVLFATTDRGQELLSDRSMWASIFIAAVVFGLGHLPAAATTFSLTPSIVAYIIVGNSVGGIVSGWLFWRRSLEAAMLAHASTYVVLVMVSILSLLVA